MSLTIKFTEYPRIRFMPEAWRDMWYLTDKVKGEVGWLGRVERTGMFTFLVHEVILPPQDANGATTEMQAEDMQPFLQQLQDERYPEIVNELTAWFHSHASMGLSRSAQDLAQWEKWSKEFASQGLPSIAGRTNQKGEIECELHLPEMGLTIEGLVPTELAVQREPEPWELELDSLIAQRVREKKYTVATKATKGGKSAGGTVLSSGGGSYGFEHYGYDYGYGYHKPGGSHPDDITQDEPGLVDFLALNRAARKWGMVERHTLTEPELKEEWDILADELAVLEATAEAWQVQNGYLEMDIAHAMSDHWGSKLLTDEANDFLMRVLTADYEPEENEEEVTE